MNMNSQKTGNYLTCKNKQHGQHEQLHSYKEAINEREI